MNVLQCCPFLIFKCHGRFKAVSERFPGKETKAVTGFFFFRSVSLETLKPPLKPSGILKGFKSILGVSRCIRGCLEGALRNVTEDFKGVSKRFRKFHMGFWAF